MGILTNGEIKKLLSKDPPLLKSRDGERPIDITIQVQPASIDLRLSNVFLKFKKDLLFIDCLIE